jgi:hypothetical protein
LLELEKELELEHWLLEYSKLGQLWRKLRQRERLQLDWAQGRIHHLGSMRSWRLLERDLLQMSLEQKWMGKLVRKAQQQTHSCHHRLVLA